MHKKDWTGAEFNSIDVGLDIKLLYENTMNLLTEWEAGRENVWLEVRTSWPRAK